MKVLFALFLFGFLQVSQSSIVHRVFVNTPYNTSIIYEYANAAFPENQPIKNGTIECFVSQLKDTGLFIDVKVTLKKAQKKGEVDVFIEPIWSLQKDTIFVDEIVFQNFKGIDENKLQELLRQKGIVAGIPLLQRDFLNIREKVQDALTEMYESDFQPKPDIEERIADITTKITLTSPGKVRVTLVTGLKSLCCNKVGN